MESGQGRVQEGARASERDSARGVVQLASGETPSEEAGQTTRPVRASIVDRNTRAPDAASGRRSTHRRDRRVRGRWPTVHDRWRETANVRVKRVDSDVKMIRAYGAHERVSVKRASAERFPPTETRPACRRLHPQLARRGAYASRYQFARRQNA